MFVLNSITQVFMLQVMRAVFTLGRTIPWSLIAFAWLTILFSLMIFIRRWKFMSVTNLVCLFSFACFVFLCHFFFIVVPDYVNNIILMIYFLCMMQRPHKAYPVELAQFHSTDYVEFLHRITPDTQHLFSDELAKCMLFSILNGHVYVILSIFFCFT